ncbi:hypothetical protein ILYODFUR_038121 [Ilyodon furcidens]|uniref:Uncharacterized protein n=1 Tax=Ilyodon furcidens TaxID=33524 RepID=A0ABV0SUT3_9TELE
MECGFEPTTHRLQDGLLPPQPHSPCDLTVYVDFGVMGSFSLYVPPARVGIGTISLWITTLTYKLQPASLNCHLHLFWGWCAHLAPKRVHVLDTEPISFKNGMMGGHCFGVFTCLSRSKRHSQKSGNFTQR